MRKIPDLYLSDEFNLALDKELQRLIKEEIVAVQEEEAFYKLVDAEAQKAMDNMTAMMSVDKPMTIVLYGGDESQAFKHIDLDALFDEEIKDWDDSPDILEHHADLLEGVVTKLRTAAKQSKE